MNYMCLNSGSYYLCSLLGTVSAAGLEDFSGTVGGITGVFFAGGDLTAGLLASCLGSGVGYGYGNGWNMGSLVGVIFLSDRFFRFGLSFFKSFYFLLSFSMPRA